MGETHFEEAIEHFPQLDEEHRKLFKSYDEEVRAQQIKMEQASARRREAIDKPRPRLRRGGGKSKAA